MDAAAQGCRPLQGLKVLELAQVMAGPVAGLMLADMGADVVKIEKLAGGDDARAFTGVGKSDVPASFQILNRGKKSVALDLKSTAGRLAFERLLLQADVLIENFRPGTMQSLGLAPERLAELNPRLIHCSITGYGNRGPLGDRGGFDLILQAFSGLMSVTGEAGRAAVKPGVSIADVNAGVLAGMGILAAYVHVLRTGCGQRVETSLLQASIQQLYWHAALFFSTGAMSPRLGSAHPIIAPYQLFSCQDGELAIGGANESNWVRITDVVGHPEWRVDPRFCTPAGRLTHRDELTACMNAVLVGGTRAHWEAALIAAGVPVGAMQTVGEALTHPQVAAVDMVIDVATPDGGESRMIGFPLHLGGHSAPARNAAPRLGQHTREILERAGFSDAEIQALLDEGAAMQSAAAAPEVAEAR